MPVQSEAQKRFMYATAEGKTDAPPAVGREFLAASHNADLPERVGMPRGKKKRSHRGKGKKPGADHRHHLHKAHEMLSKGDHAAAKRHAFDFVKALGMNAHELEESPALERKEEAKVVPSPAATKGGNPLVQALMRGR